MTAKEMMSNAIRKNLMDEFPLSSRTSTDNAEHLKVHLRIRPFTKEEIQNNHQSCLSIDGNEVMATVPKDSNAFKNNTRFNGEYVHRFRFSKIFTEETDQTQFYSETVHGLVKKFLGGQHCLVFAYGVTNSGKSYTMQGTVKNPGILPRSLETIFSHISGKICDNLHLKPQMYLDVVKLSPKQKYEERLRKENLLELASSEDACVYNVPVYSCKEVSISESQRKSQVEDTNTRGPFNSTFLDDSMIEDHVKYSVWISFVEIYNEQIFDLLEIPNQKKTDLLKLGLDRQGNTYIKELTEINITAAEEAYRLMALGQKNLRKSATKLNDNSSRSHCIFNIKLLQVVNQDNPNVAKVSMLTLCDLAGTERACKTNSTGDRLKEAGNINNSLLTLARCIETMRNNQNKKYPKLIPYRGSKLTRIFQGFFNGHGEAVMIVNVNKCSTFFDETLQVFKFSAIAKQVTIQNNAFGKQVAVLSPILPVKDLTELRRQSHIWAEQVTFCQEMSVDDEIHERTKRENNLLNIIEHCKKIIAHQKEMLDKEKMKRMMDEIRVRAEITSEMMKHFVAIEQSYSERLRVNKIQAEENSDKFVMQMLSTLTPQHGEFEDNMVPFYLFEKSQIKIRDCELMIEKLNQQLESQRAHMRRITADHSKTYSENASLHLQLHTSTVVNYTKADDITLLTQNTNHNMNCELVCMLEEANAELKNKELMLNKLEEQLEAAGEKYNEQEKNIEKLQEMIKPADTIFQCKSCKSKHEDKCLNSSSSEFVKFSKDSKNNLFRLVTPKNKSTPNNVQPSATRTSLLRMKKLSNLKTSTIESNPTYQKVGKGIRKKNWSPKRCLLAPFSSNACMGKKVKKELTKRRRSSLVCNKRKSVLLKKR